MDKTREMFLDATLHQEQFPEYLKNRELVEQLTALADIQLKQYADRSEDEIVYNPWNRSTQNRV